MGFLSPTVGVAVGFKRKDRLEEISSWECAVLCFLLMRWEHLPQAPAKCARLSDYTPRPLKW